MTNARPVRPVGLAPPMTVDAAGSPCRELEEILLYQTATGDILREISRSAFDLGSVLLTVITSAKTLRRAEMAILFRHHDGLYHFAVGLGLSTEYEALERKQTIQPGPGSLIGRAAMERRTVQIVDALRDPHYERKSDAQLGGIRCMLGIPLLREGVPIGVIGLARSRVEPFTERQIELVSSFADQAVIAIENVRLFEELQSARNCAERERDIAQAARVEAEAADQAKSTFLAAMSHEIRTPLNGVLGMMEVLEHSPLDARQARSVAVMRESAQALLHIIDEILDFSKIDAGRMEIETLPFSLSGLVASTVETMLPQARRKRLALFLDSQGAGPDWIVGDAMRVRQILFNLVGNAIKFTDRGFVRVSAQVTAQSRAGCEGAVLVRVTVTDSGIGIDEVAVSRLFEPFTQADSSTTRRFGGTGLGLSIVRRLAQLMGGDVTVQSEPGKGSRFTVTMRLAEAGSEPDMVEAAGRRVPILVTPRHSTVGLLVADDHPVNLEVMVRQLELLGLSAEVAEDGAAALALWRKAHHAVVLLDLHMPVLDGIGLAKAIRLEEATRNLPRTGLIAVTADVLMGEGNRCVLAGLDEFMSKPVSIEALARTLGRWIPHLTASERHADGDADDLFDPRALSSLFGGDNRRVASLVNNFAENAARDIAAMHGAMDATELAIFAHRLKGAARMAGAKVMAAQAMRAEAAAADGDLASALRTAEDLERLLAETLSAMRSVR